MPQPPPGAFRIVSEDPSGSRGRRAGIGASLQRQQDEDEQQAWERASTGKHASSRNTGLLRWTRFVREGEGQRQGQGESSKEVTVSAAPSPPPQAQQPQAPAEAQQSMAGLYAQLTANVASGASNTTQDGTQIPSPPATVPTTARCPTCLTLLPNPCPSSVLRTHLVSLAHRLSLNTNATRTNKSAPSTNADAEATSARLHLDAQNSGYVMLHNMGWREGAGLGVEEWEYLQQRQRQRQREEERVGSSNAPIVVDDDEEEEAADIFEANTPNAAPAASTSSHPLSPPPESSTPSQRTARKPRLVPITPAYKNDRRGLGVTPAPSHSKKNNNKHTQHHASHTSTRKQREQQIRADADRLQTIRDSLR